jgi:hypothetical protein
MNEKEFKQDLIKYFKKKLASFGCPDSYQDHTAKSMANSVLRIKRKHDKEG